MPREMKTLSKFKKILLPVYENIILRSSNKFGSIQVFNPKTIMAKKSNYQHLYICKRTLRKRMIHSLWGHHVNIFYNNNNGNSWDSVSYATLNNRSYFYCYLEHIIELCSYIVLFIRVIQIKKINYREL